MTLKVRYLRNDTIVWEALRTGTPEEINQFAEEGLVHHNADTAIVLDMEAEGKKMALLTRKA